MPLDQNPHQTVIRFGIVGFSMYACGFYVPQMRQFCLFTYPPRSKWASSEKMICFAKIGIFCKSIAGSLSEAYTQLYSFVGRVKLIICHIKHEKSSQSSRQCIGLFDVKPGFEPQARHQNKIQKVFLQRFSLSRFLAKL